MYQALYSGVSKYQGEHELVIAELSLIRSIFVVTAEVGIIHCMKLFGQAGPDSLSSFSPQYTSIWSWQDAVSRDGEAKYIAIINYLVMPLHLSCHPNIDKQD